MLVLIFNLTNNKQIHFLHIHAHNNVMLFLFYESVIFI